MHERYAYVQYQTSPALRCFSADHVSHEECFNRSSRNIIALMFRLTLSSRHSTTQTMSYASCPRGNSLISTKEPNVTKLSSSRVLPFSNSATESCPAQASNRCWSSHTTVSTALVFATRSSVVSSRSSQGCLDSDSTVSSDVGSSVLHGRFTASVSKDPRASTMSCPKNNDVSYNPSSDDLFPRQFSCFFISCARSARSCSRPAKFPLSPRARLTFDPRRVALSVDTVVLHRLANTCAIFLCLRFLDTLQLSMNHILVSKSLGPCHQVEARFVHRVRRGHEHHFSFTVSRPICPNVKSNSITGIFLLLEFLYLVMSVKTLRTHADRAPRSANTMRQLVLHPCSWCRLVGFARCFGVVLSSWSRLSRALQSSVSPDCASSRVSLPPGSRLVPVDQFGSLAAQTVLGNSGVFRLKDASNVFVHDVEALGAVQNLRGVLVCSLVLDDPPRGSKIVFAPESAPFFSDKIGRFAAVTSKFTIMSFPFAAGNLSLLRVPKGRRGSPNTLSKFNLFSRSTPFELQMQLCFGQVETTELESSIGRSSA